MARNSKLLILLRLLRNLAMVAIAMFAILVLLGPPESLEKEHGWRRKGNSDNDRQDQVNMKTDLETGKTNGDLEQELGEAALGPPRRNNKGTLHNDVTVERPIPEVWSGGSRNEDPLFQAEMRALLTEQERDELGKLCGRCLWHSITKVPTIHLKGDDVFVSTGDIDDMWIRDSSVQVGLFLARAVRRPSLRFVVEGTIRRQAFYVIQDPWANSYRKAWTPPEAETPDMRKLGRGGWVATRNYELDSGAYFLSLLWNYLNTPGLYAPERLLSEPRIYEAASLLVDVWTIEQRHEQRSPYRYEELPREGRGKETAYTGMSWSGFRPSDDPQQYGYNIAVNMYAYASLERALDVNQRVWKMPSFRARARVLMARIKDGIDKFGVVNAEDDGSQVYAYEVDGLGNKVVDFDDPNIPSLLSIPLLGYRHYDRAIYKNTVARLYTQRNPYYFKGASFAGLGSPHTPLMHIWPLADMAAALVSHDPTSIANTLRTLLKMQCGNGLMHESINANDPQKCTRSDFGWANAMYVTLLENLLGGTQCDQEMERIRQDGILENVPGARGTPPEYYNALEAHLKHV